MQSSEIIARTLNENEIIVAKPFYATLSREITGSPDSLLASMVGSA